ncbi:hypothetical protein CEE45_15140 [Candidatus Heimdallarchaeota archaeon B3_Heim]|nr:MAG: hypothetical protein CEE45_15140 [Candidatus Heimdallarchaeota archaeon B3_Heim]
MVPILIHRRKYEEIPVRDKDIVYYLQRSNKSSHNSSRKALTPDLKIQLDRMKSIAVTLYEPKGIFKIFNASELPFRECFAEAERVALAIVTIGKSLPLEANNRMKSGEYVDGVILDAFGSAGVEQVADQVNREIVDIVKSQNFEYSQRFSPGYCQWSVQDQELIFNNLPSEDIGVSLTEGYMMKPIKSVSFAINIGKDIKKSRWETRCKSCVERGQCTYRMQ